MGYIAGDLPESRVVFFSDDKIMPEAAIDAFPALEGIVADVVIVD